MSRPQGSGPRAHIVILAPNWLGDAVLALPAIADVRRAHPAARITVAARRSVADLFRLLPAADDVVALTSGGRMWRPVALFRELSAIRRADLAVLLPNSFQSAWLVRLAGIRERWGYASDLRSALLTRAVPRVKGGHQAEYYQRLTTALGFAAGPTVPMVHVPDAARTHAAHLLAAHGHRREAGLVVLAPGAAYGKAKQWVPSHVAVLITRLARERGMTSAVVGSRADAPTVREIRRALGDARVIDLVGHTSLATLAGVLAAADACVSNDSGAMHLAAAVGTPVVATFGPTNELATRPLARGGRHAEVLTHEVWCRPCMLRECPIDHRCMTGLSPDRVFDAVVQASGGRTIERPSLP